MRNIEIERLASKGQDTWRVWLVALLVCIIMILLATPTSVIAFSSTLEPRTVPTPYSVKLWNNEIYVIDVDGSNERKLTQNPADDNAPAWSPDGKKLAFLSGRDGGGIYVMNTDGSNLARLTEESGVPVWSPDSKKLTFIRGSRPIIINANGTDMTLFLPGLGEGHHLSWSPDSRRIAFASDVPHEKYYNRDASENIWVINVDGSNLVKLTDIPAGTGYWAACPNWSPDGSRIVFSYVGYPTVINPDGTNLRTLSNTSMGTKQSGHPVWSFDGRTICFISRGSSDNGKIHVIDVGNKNETVIGYEIGNDHVWSPDRKKLAFTRDRKICILDITSGRETILTEGGYPTWSPDGKKIAFVKVAIVTKSPSFGSWVPLALAPSLGESSTLMWDGNDYIYAGSGYRYSISSNSWSSIATIPDKNTQPYDLIWLDGEGLCTFEGKDVWCYYPSSDSWKRIASFPGEKHIASLGVTRPDNKYIYVHDGTSFWRYTFSNNLWGTVAEGLWCPPNPTAMVWTGGDFIYGFSTSRQESGERAFWRYSISSNQWSALSMPPGQVAVGGQGHLAWSGGDYIYLYGGESRTTPHLWRYSMLGDTWEALESVPEDEVAAIVATSSGIYVASGGVYSELLGSAPSWFYFSPSPAPISVPGIPQELRKVSVHLYGQKTQVTVDEDVILELSAVNLITNPAMTIQLILQVPSGMSVTSTAFVEAGAGQYTATYVVEPGYARQIEVHIRPNQSGSFNIVGYLAYYIGGDKSTAEYRTVNMPVKVATDKASAEERTTETSRKGTGFLSCSTPTEGALPPSAGELLAGLFPIGLTWGSLGVYCGVMKWRRRKNHFASFL